MGMSGLKVQVVDDSLRVQSPRYTGKAEWDEAARLISEGKTVWVRCRHRQVVDQAMRRRGIERISTHRHEGGFVVWTDQP